MLDIDDYRQIMHEIKNTICLINSSLQLIQTQHPEVEEFNYWQDVMSDVQSLKKITYEVPDFKQGKRLQLEPTNVSEFWNQVLHSLYPTLNNHIQCTINIPDSLPLIAMDSFFMKQAINNIVKNSYEAMNGNGTLIIQVYQKQDSVIFEIQDSGCGMDEETLASIFHPFFSKKEFGYGLGLPYTKAIVESHGGSLACSSKLGKGTLFTITLPVLSTETETPDPTSEGA